MKMCLRAIIDLYQQLDGDRPEDGMPTLSAADFVEAVQQHVVSAQRFLAKEITSADFFAGRCVDMDLRHDRYALLDE
jgi:hypothetical protein